MQFIASTQGDDPDFIHYVETLVSLIAGASVPGIYITRIKGWFGDRWVGFAGKVAGAAGVRFMGDFNIPPFVPSRVVASSFLSLTEAGYVAEPPPVRLHIDQPSEANFRRKLSVFTPHDALLWFSGDTARNGRGSVLAYVPSSGGHEVWFVDLSRASEWHIVKSIGVSPRELGELGRCGLRAE